MADSVIVPAAQVPTVVAAGGQQAQSATETATRPIGLAPGTTVSGTITGKDDGGNFLLKTPQGTFALQSDTPLTYNSDVTIRLGGGASGANTTRIVSVNGEPYADFSAPEPEASDSVSSSLLTQAAQPSESNAAPAQVVRATVLATPLSTEQQSANAALTPGNTVTLRVAPPADEPAATPSPPAVSAAAQEAVPTVTGNQAVQATPEAATQPGLGGQSAPSAAAASAPEPQAQAAAPVTPPTAAPASSSSPSPPSSFSPTAASSPSPAGQPQNAPQQVVQESTATPVSVLYGAYKQSSALPASPAASAPAPAATAATSPSAAASPVPAQVVSAAPDGTVQLQTPLGAVTLQAASDQPLAALMAGAEVTVELVAAQSAQTASAAQLGGSAPAADVAELAGSWQSLKDILDLEENANPAGAKTGLLARLPELGPGFLGKSLSVINSLIQGDARGLLGGDTVEAIRQGGRQDLVEKFAAEAASIAQAYNAPVQKQQADWQMLFLPFVFQDTLQQARIYVKRDAPKKDRNAASASPETRFVVEVDLSELGGVQMDGLVRRKEQTVAFDLVVRSHNAFDGEEQKAILAIYNDAAQITGFKGSLAFQVTRDFPVKPLEEVQGRDITA